MPQLATARSPQALAVSVRTYLPKFRYMQSITVPDVVGGPHKYVLYGSHTSCVDALIEAKADYPNLLEAWPTERLSREDLKRSASALEGNPVAKAMRNLGLVNPDGTPM